MKLGTILPTRTSLALNDEYARAMSERNDAIGRKELAHCERRVVGGEVRYYDTTDQYAVVSRQGAILWFQVTPDGDYRM